VATQLKTHRTKHTLIDDVSFRRGSFPVVPSYKQGVRNEFTVWNMDHTLSDVPWHSSEKNLARVRWVSVYLHWQLSTPCARRLRNC